MEVDLCRKTSKMMKRNELWIRKKNTLC